MSRFGTGTAWPPVRAGTRGVSSPIATTAADAASAAAEATDKIVPAAGRATD